jgi:hypothetical protein
MSKFKHHRNFPKERDRYSALFPFVCCACRKCFRKPYTTFKPMSPVRWRDVNGQQEICCPKDGRCGPVAEGSVFDRSWISLSTRLHHNLTRRFAESEVPKHIGRGEELRD